MDLSNICVTADAADEEWLQAHVAAPLAALTAALDNGAQAALPEPLDAPAVLAALEGLTAAVGTATGGGATEEGDGEGEEGEAACGGGCCSSGSGSSGSVSRAGNAKKMAAAQGVMNLLGRLWGVDDAAAGGQGRAVLLASLALAEALLTPVAGGGGAEEAELRDSLWPTGMLRLCEAARSREGDVEFLMVGELTDPFDAGLSRRAARLRAAGLTDPTTPPHSASSPSSASSPPSARTIRSTFRATGGSSSCSQSSGPTAPTAAWCAGPAAPSGA